MMKTKIFIASWMLVLASLTILNAQPIHEVLKVVAENNQGNFERELDDHFGASVSISGNYAIVGSYNDKDENGKNPLKDAGAAYILNRQAPGDPWKITQKIVASDRDAEDSFSSVAISGKYAIVGAPGEDHDENGNSPLEKAGSAYIFERVGSVWKQIKKIVASDRAAGDNFGGSVSISGNYIIVGAAWHGPRQFFQANPFVEFGAGAAYIFERKVNGNWKEVEILQAHDKTEGDLFGSVSISGNYAVVGAHREDDGVKGPVKSNSGSAYIFERNPTAPLGKSGPSAWTQTQKIEASDRETNDHYGYSVAISGDYAIVGAYAEDMISSDDDWAGAAYIYKHSYSVKDPWKQIRKIVPLNRTNKQVFGIGVSIDGDYALVGAYGSGPQNSGSVYIFDRKTNTSWGQIAEIKPTDLAIGDNFGRFVSISGCTAFIGSWTEDEDQTGGNTIGRAGSAYLFECEESACKIPKFKVSLKQIKLGDNFNLNISSAAMIKKVEVSLASHQTNYNNDLCEVKSGVIGNISSSTPNFGGLTLTNNNSPAISWVTGLPSPLNGNVVLSVSKPGILNLPCCEGTYNFCLLVKVTDIKGNICEEKVCVSTKLKSLTQFSGDTDIKPF